MSKKYVKLSDRQVREFLANGGQFMAPVRKTAVVAGHSGHRIGWVVENSTPIRIGSDGDDYTEDD